MIKKLLSNQIILAFLIIASVWFLFQIKTILISLFIALIISSTLNPIAQKLETKKIPRTASIILLYLLFACILVILIVPFFPFINIQGRSLAASFPVYVSQLNYALGNPISNAEINSFINAEMGSISKNLLQTSSKILGGMLTAISTLVISFYLSLEHAKLKKDFVSLFPSDKQKLVLKISNESEWKLGAWVRGQFILCLFIGVLTYIALRLLGVEYALILAIIAGLLEIIPTVGPIIAAIPAVIVALSISPVSAIGVIAAYLLIQQLENHFLVPKIMNTAVGLSPIVIIIAVVTGSHLMGIPGALLAIPFVTVVSVVIANLKANSMTAHNKP